MRPVRGQRKSAGGSSHNIALVHSPSTQQKKGGKRPEIQQPVEGVVNEEEEDEAQVLYALTVENLRLPQIDSTGTQHDCHPDPSGCQSVGPGQQGCL